MRKDILELNYTSTLDLMETQFAIKFVKDTFQKYLVNELNLLRVSAPLFVLSKTGLNDNLNGVEKPVSFKVKGINDNVEIIHSLAKWKRMALAKYGFKAGSGLYTDMNAIRKDEIPDFCHSIYVDQWDWERVIKKEDRNKYFLMEIVEKIYRCIYQLSVDVSTKFPKLHHDLPEKITFISTKHLESLYPNLSRKEREDQITRDYKAVFLYKIGGPLSDGLPHDGRAADYDDWSLNGDLLLYYPLYDMGLELSSMGIRVDAEALKMQLKAKNEEYKLNNKYCKAVLNEKLPFTIGGGIGQSRLCMFMLNKAHIGEVQASIWSEKDIKTLQKHNIYLL